MHRLARGWRCSVEAQTSVWCSLRGLSPDPLGRLWILRVCVRRVGRRLYPQAVHPSPIERRLQPPADRPPPLSLRNAVRFACIIGWSAAPHRAAASSLPRRRLTTKRRWSRRVLASHGGCCWRCWRCTSATNGAERSSTTSITSTCPQTPPTVRRRIYIRPRTTALVDRGRRRTHESYGAIDPQAP